MKKLILGCLIFSLSSCDTSNLKSKEVDHDKIGSGGVVDKLNNSRRDIEKATEKRKIRKQLFNVFLKKFKKIDFPYIYRYPGSEEYGREKFKLNQNSSDTLFIKTEYFDESYFYGYLSDTSNFFSLIYFLPAESLYPVLATYTKNGDLLNQESLIVYGCGSDCGLKYCSQTVTIRNDFMIEMVDSSKYEGECDEEGNYNPKGHKLYIHSKRGRIKKNGEIEMSKISTKVIK